MRAGKVESSDISFFNRGGEVIKNGKKLGNRQQGLAAANQRTTGTGLDGGERDKSPFTGEGRNSSGPGGNNSHNRNRLRNFPGMSARGIVAGAVVLIH